MTDDRLALVPRARMLPETDFPSARRTTQATKPGDTASLEKRLAQKDGVAPAAVRLGRYGPLATVADRSRALPRLSAGFRSALSAAVAT